MTERSIFSQHLRGCRKHTRIRRPGSEGNMIDENIKEGEDFLKEGEDDDKEVSVLAESPISF